MAIANKWKSSQESASPEMDSIESQILEAEGEISDLGVRSDWTMQRKMGVAMGIVGAILVIVGVAPMVLDSDNLKGSLAESQEEAPDPLVALFGGGSSNTTTSTEPENSQFAVISPSGVNGTITIDGVTTIVGNGLSEENTTLPVETVSFGGTEDTSIEMEVQPTTINVTLPENSGDGQFTTMTIANSEDTINISDTTISSEVDKIIAEETIIENGGTPVNLSSVNNTNTGTTDALGAEFMTANPNVASLNSASTETFHASAGLQNTSVKNIKNTKLTNSGPADMALIMFLLSLFVVGGVRYRKELF